MDSIIKLHIISVPTWKKDIVNSQVEFTERKKLNVKKQESERKKGNKVARLKSNYYQNAIINETQIHTHGLSSSPGKFGSAHPSHKLSIQFILIGN